VKDDGGRLRVSMRENELGRLKERQSETTECMQDVQR
jgi:hypothetical protein